MNKRIIAMILAIVVSMSFVPFSVFAAEEEPEGLGRSGIVAFSDRVILEIQSTSEGFEDAATVRLPAGVPATITIVHTVSGTLTAAAWTNNATNLGTNLLSAFNAAFPTINFALSGTASTSGGSMRPTATATYVVTPSTAGIYTVSPEFPTAAYTNAPADRYGTSLTFDIYTPIEVDSISLDEVNMGVQVGEEFELTVTIDPSDASNQTIDWTFDKPGVVEVVSTTGNITKFRALTADSVTITATSAVNALATATSAVIVSAFDPSNIKYMYVGPTTLDMFYDTSSNDTVDDYLEAFVYTKTSNNPDAPATKLSPELTTLTWESSDTGIVEVDSDGKLIAKAPGTAIIKATSANPAVFAESEVTVHGLDGVTGVIIRPAAGTTNITVANMDTALAGIDRKNLKTLVIASGTLTADSLRTINAPGDFGNNWTAPSFPLPMPELETLAVIGSARGHTTGYQNIGYNNPEDDLDYDFGKLKKVILYNTPTLQGQAFRDSVALEYVFLRDTTTFSGTMTFQMPRFSTYSQLHTLRAPKLTNIYNRAFYYCVALETLELGSAVPAIEPFTGESLVLENIYAVTFVVPDMAAYNTFVDMANNLYASWFIYPFRALNGEVLPEIERHPEYKEYNDREYDWLRSYQWAKGLSHIIAGTQPYNTDDIPIGLNFYTFERSMQVGGTRWVVPPATGDWDWPTGVTGGSVAQLSTPEVIRWAKDAGFDSVDITAYYFPGYSNTAMPSASTQANLLEKAREVKQYAEDVGIRISGTGIQNSFADVSSDRRTTDAERIQFYLKMADEMGAPVLRLFVGRPPPDVGIYGWKHIMDNRVIPDIIKLADWAEANGIKAHMGIQTHGDMLSTGNQALYLMYMVNKDKPRPNVGIINDVGYFYDFLDSANKHNFPWYTDINNLLPLSNNFQFKKKPAGAGTTAAWLDLDRVFSDIRSSSYRGDIPIEMLWGGSGFESDYAAFDPEVDFSGFGNRTLEATYAETIWYMNHVRAAMERTKAGPVDPIDPADPVYPDDPPPPIRTGDSRDRGSGGSIVGSGIISRPAFPTVPSVTANDAAAMARSALNEAIASGSSTATIRFINMTNLTLEAMQAMDGIAGETAIRVHIDTVNPSGSVDVRITVDPSKATQDIQLTASTTSDAAKSTKALFENSFGGTMSVISLSQRGSFGMEVRIAAEIDPGLDVSSLIFYSYNKAANTYIRIYPSLVAVDRNGYLHFNTRLGGDIITTNTVLPTTR